jgi:UDP-N-acetylglucosamine 2-epimerase (non-hydrolysing)
MKLGIIYGTRPEYLKILPLINKLPCKVIRITQHDTIAEPDLIYDILLQIDTVCENRLDNLGSQILQKLGPNLKDFTHVLVQGDTSTVFYSALCAYQNNIKVIHLEAGLRTYDIYKPYPEEGYRQMISRISEIHLCPHIKNSNVLVREKVNGDIHLVGNTILDLVRSYNLTITNGKKILITFHRRENLQYLEDFIRNLNTCSEKEFLWFLHPNKDLQTRIKTLLPNCQFAEPCGHREFLEYVKDCHCILTDSGGIQEECAFLGKPCIVLREFTERDQIPEPYLYLCKPPYNNLKTLLENIPNKQLDPCYVYGSGNSVDLITRILNEEQYA